MHWSLHTRKAVPASELARELAEVLAHYQATQRLADPALEGFARAKDGVEASSKEGVSVVERKRLLADLDAQIDAHDPSRHIARLDRVKVEQEKAIAAALKLADGMTDLVQVTLSAQNAEHAHAHGRTFRGKRSLTITLAAHEPPVVDPLEV